VVAKQQAARRRAREEEMVDRWRRQQMDSWHEQQESRRASEEAKANLRAARHVKAREALKTERSQIREWAAEQKHAWRAVEEAEEDGKKALRRAAMEEQGKRAEKKTLLRWVREEDRAWHTVARARRERATAEKAITMGGRVRQPSPASGSSSASGASARFEAHEDEAKTHTEMTTTRDGGDAGAGASLEHGGGRVGSHKAGEESLGGGRHPPLGISVRDLLGEQRLPKKGPEGKGFDEMRDRSPGAGPQFAADGQIESLTAPPSPTIYAQPPARVPEHKEASSADLEELGPVMRAEAIRRERQEAAKARKRAEAPTLGRDGAGAARAPAPANTGSRAPDMWHLHAEQEERALRREKLQQEEHERKERALKGEQVRDSHQSRWPSVDGGEQSVTPATDSTQGVWHVESLHHGWAGTRAAREPLEGVMGGFKAAAAKSAGREGGGGGGGSSGGGGVLLHQRSDMLVSRPSSSHLGAQGDHVAGSGWKQHASQTSVMGSKHSQFVKGGLYGTPAGAGRKKMPEWAEAYLGGCISCHR